MRSPETKAATDRKAKGPPLRGPAVHATPLVRCARGSKSAIQHPRQGARLQAPYPKDVVPARSYPATIRRESCRRRHLLAAVLPNARPAHGRLAPDFPTKARSTTTPLPVPRIVLSLASIIGFVVRAGNANKKCARSTVSPRHRRPCRCRKPPRPRLSGGRAAASVCAPVVLTTAGRNFRECVRART